MFYSHWRARFSSVLRFILQVPDRSFRRPFLCSLFGLLVLLVCYSPWLLLFFRRLARSDYYQHFPWLLAAAGWLMFRRCRGQATAVPGWGAGVLTAVSLLFFGAGQLMISPWLIAVSALFLLLAWLRMHGAPPGRIVPAWLLLWLFVPLPLDEAFAYQLQEVACRMASGLLEVWSVEHLVTGLTIETASGVYLVHEACSGMRSLFALLAGVSVAVVWWARCWAVSLFLVGAVLPLAVVANAVRIAVTVLGDRITGGLLAQDWLHLPLGVVSFVLCLVILYHWAGILETSWPRRTRTTRESPKKSAGTQVTPYPLGWTLGMSAAIAAASLLTPLARQAEATWVRDEVRQLAFYEDDLPGVVEEWRRTAFEIHRRRHTGGWGPCSNIWRYDKETLHALISCDYPFAGWHGLESCYHNLGWQAEQRRGVGGLSTAVEFELVRGDGVKGYLIYSEYYVTGEPLQPLDPAVWSFQGVVAYGLNRVRKGVGRFGQSRAVVQLQLFAVVEDEEIRPELRSLFLAARKRLLRVMEARRQQMLSSNAGASES